MSKTSKLPLLVACCLAILCLLLFQLSDFGGIDRLPVRSVAFANPYTAEASASEDNWHGFVADEVCAECHSSIAESFQTLGMARSFARPENASRIEDFSSSGIKDGRLTYRLSLEGEKIVFSQWQTAPDGEPIHLWQRPVDWVLGSGSASRVYFLQSAEGLLFELPLAWYTQEASWGTKPGGERGNDEAGLRVVQRGCMFCHNAVPTDPSFQDERFAPPVFPAKMPEGIGCQRCHGPGQSHVAKALEAKALQGSSTGPKLTSEQRRSLRDAVRSTIVDPKDLSAERRRDVCAQCHHQPSVSVFGQRRLDRGDYQFTAGQNLQDFLLKLEVQERDRDGKAHGKQQRFEINHHGYRLEQSSCFVESKPGDLECTSCHDPHNKPARIETLRRTRSQCLACHTEDGKTQAPLNLAGEDRAQHFEREDCVSCHMPKRRTQDVVHVVMTDHRIQSRPLPEEERLAPQADRTTFPVSVTPLTASAGPQQAISDSLALASGSIRMGFLDPAKELPRMLSDASELFSNADLSEPRLRLAQAHLLRGDLEKTKELLETLLADLGSLEFNAAQQTRIWLSMVAARQNRPGDALAVINQAIEMQESQVAVRDFAWLYNHRGRLRSWMGQPAEACKDFERAVSSNEFLARAWFQVGRCHISTRDYPAAAKALEKSLSLDPNADEGARPLVAVLAALGREQEARRVILHHGLE